MGRQKSITPRVEEIKNIITMTKATPLSPSVRKYIRRQKMLIRKTYTSTQEQQEKIDELYKKFQQEETPTQPAKKDKADESPSS